MTVRLYVNKQQKLEDGGCASWTNADFSWLGWLGRGDMDDMAELDDMCDLVDMSDMGDMGDSGQGWQAWPGYRELLLPTVEKEITYLLTN